MRFFRVSLLAALPLCLIALLAEPASAKKNFFDAICQNIKLNEKIANCALCHAGEKPSEHNLGKYGQAFRAALAATPRKGPKNRYVAAMEAIADQDSDGDGATNGEEIALGTFPGDPKSTPTAEQLAAYRKEHPKK